MKKPTDPLLHDLFAEGGLSRHAPLDRSLASFRKGRRRRHAARAAMALPLLLALAWIALPRREDAPRAIAAHRSADPATAQYVPGTSVRIIGDEELLRLLQGQPVALVSTPRGKQVVLFDQLGAAQ